LEVYYQAGTKAYYYVNGSLVSTITTTLPTGTTDADFLFKARILNAVAESKVVEISGVRVLQVA